MRVVLGLGDDAGGGKGGGVRGAGAWELQERHGRLFNYTPLYGTMNGSCHLTWLSISRC